MAFGLSFILGPWTQLLILIYAPYESFKVSPVFDAFLLRAKVRGFSSTLFAVFKLALADS